MKKLERKRKAILSKPKDETQQSTFDSVLENRRKKSQKKLAELKRLQKDFFNEESRKRKKELAGDIDRIEWELVEGTLKEQGNEDAMQKLAQYKKNKSKPFLLWKLYFSEVFQRENPGFDVVIANPPYVQIKQIPWNDRKIYKNNFESAVGRFNLFYFFLELTNKIVKQRGFSAFIVPDRLLLNTQCSKLRKWLLNDQQIIEIDSFDESVFESAVVDNIIIMYKNSQQKYNTTKIKNKITLNELGELKPELIPIIYLKKSQNNQFDLNYNPQVDAIFDNIRSKSIELGKVAETKDGIIQSKVADKLFLKKPLDDDSKKLLFGKNVVKYKITFDNKWVNYKQKEMMQIEVERKGIGVGSGLRLRKTEIFERNKILTRQTADEIIASYDTQNYYYANTLHGTTITDERFNPLYILAILNSKITTWYYRSTTAECGKVFAQIKIEILRQIPILDIIKEQQKPFIDLVDQIHSITCAPDYLENPTKQTRVKTLEKPARLQTLRPDPPKR